MIYIRKFAVLVLVFSQGIVAEEYRTFVGGNYSELESSLDIKSASLYVSHYLKDRETLGPLNEFDYINKISVLNANYSQVRYSDRIDYRYNIGGDVFYKNFLFGANYRDNNADKKGESLKLGYLINDNLLVSAQRSRRDIDLYDTLSPFVRSSHSYATTVQAQYNHALDGGNYIGVTAKSTREDDSERRSIESKYFTKLGNGQYLSVGILYSDHEDEKFWSTGASYYFSKYTSLSASYDDLDQYTVNGSHYFTDNFALHAGYSNNAKDTAPVDFRQVSIGAVYQF